MQDIPVIRPGRQDLVVEELRYRRRLFFRGEWVVVWRSRGPEGTRYRARIRAGERNGTVVVDGQPFPFSIRWRAERRRPLLWGAEDEPRACRAEPSVGY